MKTKTPISSRRYWNSANITEKRCLLEAMEILENYSPKMIARMVADYRANISYCRKLMDEFRNPETPPLPKVKRISGTTFVYMMRCNRNGLVKIGRSTKPTLREKTLQSEDPSVEMIFCVETNEQVESCLHAAFEANRVRGEWFRLSEAEMQTAVALCERFHSLYSKREFRKLPIEEQRKQLEQQAAAMADDAEFFANTKP